MQQIPWRSRVERPRKQTNNTCVYAHTNSLCASLWGLTTKMLNHPETFVRSWKRAHRTGMLRLTARVRSDLLMALDEKSGAQRSDEEIHPEGTGNTNYTRVHPTVVQMFQSGSKCLKTQIYKRGKGQRHKSKKPLFTRNTHNVCALKQTRVRSREEGRLCCYSSVLTRTNIVYVFSISPWNKYVNKVFLLLRPGLFPLLYFCVRNQRDIHHMVWSVRALRPFSLS